MSETVENRPPLCPKCGSARTARIKRVGVMQTMVLPHFGIYPWECSGCRKEFLFKNRGRLKRKRRSTGEVHVPPVSQSGAHAVVREADSSRGSE